MWVVVDEAGGAAQEGRRRRAQSPRRPALTGGRPQACGGVGVVQRQAYREVLKDLREPWVRATGGALHGGWQLPELLAVQGSVGKPGEGPGSWSSSWTWSPRHKEEDGER